MKGQTLYCCTVAIIVFEFVEKTYLELIFYKSESHCKAEVKRTGSSTLFNAHNAGELLTSGFIGSFKPHAAPMF